MKQYSKFIISNFVHSLIPTSRMQNSVRWDDDDAITRDLLSMRSINISKMAGKFKIEFGVDVVPLDNTPNCYFLILYTR
jgi:hypothetical protein